MRKKTKKEKTETPLEQTRISGYIRFYSVTRPERWLSKWLPVERAVVLLFAGNVEQLLPEGEKLFVFTTGGDHMEIEDPAQFLKDQAIARTEIKRSNPDLWSKSERRH